jgi:hypothetical protein
MIFDGTSSPPTDIGVQIVEHQIDILRTHDENEGSSPDGTTTSQIPATLATATVRQEFVPLGDRVVLAVTGRRRDQALLGCPAADGNLRNDVSIDLAMDRVERWRKTIP